MTASIVEARADCRSLRHDTSTAYKKYGCRCNAARKAEMARRKNYSRNRPQHEVGNMLGLVLPGLPNFRTDPNRGCANLDNPDIMFAPRGPELAAAKEVCGGCPFRDECHQWALDHAQIYGVWGGISAGERRKEIRRRHRQAAGADAA